MESSRQDLFIDMVVCTFIFDNDQIKLFRCFTSTGVGLPKTGVIFTKVYLGYIGITLSNQPEKKPITPLQVHLTKNLNTRKRVTLDL